MQLASERVHLRTALADHDARPGGVDVDLDLVRVLADRDLGQAGVTQLRVDVIADRQVLHEVLRELLLVEPRRLPVVDVADSHRLGMDFLTHGYALFVKLMVMWLVRLRILVARPSARGRNLLMVGPSSTITWKTRSSSGRSSWLCSALAIADSRTFRTGTAAARGV